MSGFSSVLDPKKPKIPLDKFSPYAIIQKLSDSTTEFGGIAQLGERLNGIQEVSGSIPLISTKSEKSESKERVLKSYGFRTLFFVFVLKLF